MPTNPVVDPVSCSGDMAHEPLPHVSASRPAPTLIYEDDRNGAGLPLQRGYDGGRHCEDHIGLQGEQLLRKHRCLNTGRCEAIIDADIAAGRPPEPFEFVPESRKTCFGVYIVLRKGHQHPDPLHLLRLLRARRERPSVHADR